jgi:hypothetical protein
MTQKQTTLWERLARASLLLLFVGLPLLYYVAPSGLSALEASGLFDDYRDIYIAGQPLDLPRPSFHWQRLWSLPYALVLLGKAIGLPVLLAGLGSTLLLVMSWWAVRRCWPQWQLQEPRTVAGFGGRLLMLLGLAYCVGCLVHLIVPAWLFKPPVVSQAFHYIILEEYWYPYYGWPLQPLPAQGWTIYAPIDVSFLYYSLTKASGIKLGALLATLLLYRCQLRRSTVGPKATQLA